MAVTVAGVVESLRTGTTDPHTWTHNAGVTSPQGVLVAIMHGDSATDHAVSVTYGGVSLTRRSRHTDTATEAGAAEWWFLGSSVPTGSQTVSVDLSTATVEDIHFVSITLDANDDVEVVDEDGLDANVANPSVTLQYQGRTCMAFAAFYSGQTAISAITAGANCTLFTTSELAGNYTSICLRQTTAGSTDFAIAATVITDDVAYAALAVSEVQKLTPPVAAAPITLTGAAPTVTVAPPVINTPITPGAGLLLLTRHTIDLIPVVEEVTLTGYAPGVSISSGTLELTPPAGALALTGVGGRMDLGLPGGGLIAQRLLGSGTETTNTTDYTTATFTARANTLLTIAILSSRSLGDGAQTPSSVTGFGETWALMLSGGFDPITAPPFHRLSVYRTVLAADTTAAIVIAHDSTHSGCSWIVREWTGTRITGSDGADAILAVDTLGGDASVADLTFALAADGDDARNLRSVVVGTDSSAVTISPTGAYTGTGAALIASVPDGLLADFYAPAGGGNQAGTISPASDWRATVFILRIPAETGGALALTGAAPALSLVGATTILPAAGTLTLTGATPALQFQTFITPPAGALVFTSDAPAAVDSGAGAINVQTMQGTLTLTGVAPVLVVETTRSPQVGTLTLAGAAPIRGVGIVPSTGTLTLTGAAPARGLGLSPSAGALTLTGVAPLVRLALFVTPGAGALTLTGQLAQIEGAFSLAPLAGVLTLTGATPALAQPVAITPAVGALTLTGLATTALTATFRTPLVGALTLTGLAPTRLTDARPTPTAGVLTLAGQAASASTSTLKSPPAGTLALTGAAPAVNRTIVPSTGALSLTGAAPVMTFVFARQPTAGALTLTGYQPSAVDSGAGATNRQTMSGALVLTGQAPVLSTAFSIRPTVGSLTLTGQAPSLSRSITPPVGTLTLAGAAPIVSSGRLIQPQVGALTLVGVAPSALTDRRITPAVGALTLTGAAPTFLSGTGRAPATGALTLTGQVPSLLIVIESPELTPEAGQLTLIGIAPVLSAMVSITPTAGALILTGYAPTRVDSGSGLGSIVIADTKTLQPVNGTRSLQVINDTVSLQPNRRVREIGTLEPLLL